MNHCFKYVVGNKMIYLIARHIKHKVTGGGSGIRTHGRLAPTAVFKTAALNRSAIPPIIIYFIAL